MLLGMLIPFLLVIVFGLDRILSRGVGNNIVKLGFLAIIVLLIAASEIATSWAAFDNDFNWYHLP